MTSTLAIIPARGGSKGILRKNLKPLAGKPLIVWTIEQALATPGLDVCVSTETGMAPLTADEDRTDEASHVPHRPWRAGTALARIGRDV